MIKANRSGLLTNPFPLLQSTKDCEFQNNNLPIHCKIIRQTIGQSFDFASTQTADARVFGKLRPITPLPASFRQGCRVDWIEALKQ
ncbi:hypothetical protein [Methylomicrobium lacus]|uniref:hypothetical protein n=1 Tax=Methylomicrobium lacus TaxID=136992 RepID=UPI0035A96038